MKRITKEEVKKRDPKGERSEMEERKSEEK